MKEDEVGGTCGMHGEGEMCLHGFNGEDVGVDEGITLRWALG